MVASLLVAASIGLLVVLLVLAVATGWFTRQRRFGIASLTAWHDWQPSDKQRATETVIEERAGRGARTEQERKESEQ